jgi:hypothetical protein
VTWLDWASGAALFAVLVKVFRVTLGAILGGRKESDTPPLIAPDDAITDPVTGQWFKAGDGYGTGRGYGYGYGTGSVVWYSDGPLGICSFNEPPALGKLAAAWNRANACKIGARVGHAAKGGELSMLHNEGGE